MIVLKLRVKAGSAGPFPHTGTHSNVIQSYNELLTHAEGPPHEW